MLGKLIKNDFKQTAHSVVAVYCAALGAMAFMALSYLTKVTWMGVVGSVALVVVGALTIIMTLVAVVANFQRSLYGAQGYLTFTLPVKSSQILFSKVLVSTIWIIISYLAFISTFVICYFYAKIKTNGFTDGIVGMIQSFEFIGEINSKGLIAKFLILIALGALLLILTFISYVFFAFTIANTRPLQKHPMAYGLIIFMILHSAVQSINVKLMYSFPLCLVVKMDSVKLGFIAMDDAYTEGVLFSIGIAGVLFIVVIAALFLFLTGWIMEKKVNLK